MIYVREGLQKSLQVLNILKKDKSLKNVDICIGTITNGRECGLTFIVSKGIHSFTFCVYEHRNSDNIIINGREGYINLNGDLPYTKDSAYSYLASFEYNEVHKTAKTLSKMIKLKNREFKDREEK